MKIHEFIKVTMDHHGIVGKELASIVGITRNHLSEVRAGRKWLSEDTLISLLEGMDKIRPGARLYFCQLLAGEALNSLPANKPSLVEMIKTASDEEIEAALIAIGKRWKESRASSIKNDNETTNIYIHVAPIVPTDKVAV